MNINSRYLVLASLLSAVVALAGCQEDIEFTRKPIARAAQIQSEQVRSTIFVTSRIDLSDIEARLDKALPKVIATVSKRVKRAACVVKKNKKRCSSARVKGRVIRAGAIKIEGDGNQLSATLPLRYELLATGTGRAKSVRETIQGTITARVNFAVTLDPNWYPIVVADRKISWADEPAIKVLAGTLSLDRVISGRIRKNLRNVSAALADLLGQSSMIASAQTTWRHLHYPIKVSENPDLWIRGEPSGIRFAGFSNRDDGLEMRMGIDAMIKTFPKERPVPLLASDLPALTQDATAEGTGKLDRSRIVIPWKLDIARLRERASQVLPEGTVIEADIGGRKLEMVTGATEIYASQGRLALAIKVLADFQDAWSGLSGTIYLTGLPTIRQGQTTLGLSRVDFTKPNQIPKLYDGGRFIVPNAPFIKVFRDIVAVDLADDFANTLSNSQSGIGASFGPGFQLVGRFDKIEARSLAPMSDGILINLDLIGEVAIANTVTPDNQGSIETTAGEE